MQKLMDLLKKKIQWDANKVQKIRDNLDHKDKDKITWDEFLEWF